MVSSREVGSKVLRMPIQFEFCFFFCFFFFFNDKNANGECNVKNFRRFLFGLSPDVPAFKVLVLTGDFKFWIGVNEY